MSTKDSEAPEGGFVGGQYSLHKATDSSVVLNS